MYMYIEIILLWSRKNIILEIKGKEKKKQFKDQKKRNRLSNINNF